MDAGVVCTDWMRPTPPPVLATHSHQSQGVVLDRRPSFPLKNSGPALIEREPLENLTTVKLYNSDGRLMSDGPVGNRRT
jgi:hypothetical protein